MSTKKSVAKMPHLTVAKIQQKNINNVVDMPTEPVILATAREDSTHGGSQSAEQEGDGGIN
jgi:hypothetical protein